MRWFVGSYLLGVLAISLLMICGLLPAWGSNEGVEDVVNWIEAAEIEVPAKPAGVWTLAHEYLEGPALIKVESQGEWTYSTAKTCGPDGDLNALVSSAHAILASAPLGALIMKVGGSTAGTSDGETHVVGRAGIVRIDDGKRGPIFLTINDELTGLADNSGELKVKLSIAKDASSPAGGAAGNQ